jgi:hypothetical protein
VVTSQQVNPYASFLEGRNPVDVIAATPQRLRSLAEALGPKGIERGLAPGKWSARSILCHLADTEVVFAFRLRQSLAEPHHVIQPYDQDLWARSYAGYQTQEAIDLFSTVRHWNLTLLEGVPKEALAKPLTHPERGQMTFQVLIETMAGHDLNHLVQLEAIAAK